METDHNSSDRPSPPQMAIGWIVAAVLIFLAQRDMRKRSSELVRGPVGVWKVVGLTPPGAVAYLVFGRRRSGASPELDTSGATTT